MTALFFLIPLAEGLAVGKRFSPWEKKADRVSTLLGFIGYVVWLGVALWTFRLDSPVFADGQLVLIASLFLSLVHVGMVVMIGRITSVRRD